MIDTFLFMHTACASSYGTAVLYDIESVLARMYLFFVGVVVFYTLMPFLWLREVFCLVEVMNRRADCEYLCLARSTSYMITGMSLVAVCVRFLFFVLPPLYHGFQFLYTIIVKNTHTHIHTHSARYFHAIIILHGTSCHYLHRCLYHL